MLGWKSNHYVVLTQNRRCEWIGMRSAQILPARSMIVVVVLGWAVLEALLILKVAVVEVVAMCATGGSCSSLISLRSLRGAVWRGSHLQATPRVSTERIIAEVGKHTISWPAKRGCWRQMASGLTCPGPATGYPGGGAVLKCGVGGTEGT